MQNNNTVKKEKGAVKMNADEKKQVAFEIFLLAGSALAFLYFFSKTGISFDYSFDLSKTQDLMNIEIIKNLAISVFFISLSIFFINYFAKGIVKKERALTTTLSILIAAGFFHYFHGLTEISATMLFFYWLGFMFISLKTHKKPKNAWEKIGIGWAHSKNIILALAIGGLVTGMYFTNLNLNEYQNIVKESIVTVAIEASEQFMPEGYELDKSIAITQRSLFTNLIEDMPLFQSFLNTLPILTGLMLASIIYTVGNMTIPFITAFLCLFLKTEKEPEVKLKQKKGLFDNVPIEEEKE